MTIAQIVVEILFERRLGEQKVLERIAGNHGLTNALRSLCFKKKLVLISTLWIKPLSKFQFTAILNNTKSFIKHSG